MSINRRDLVAGLLCISGAAASSAYCLTSLNLGTPLRMGAGFYPLLLSIILLCLGIVLAISATRSSGGETASTTLRWRTIFRKLPWRAMLMLSSAPLGFALSIEHFGFIVAVALLFSMAALSSYHSKILELIILTIGMTALCVIIFYSVLGLPLSLTGALLSGYGEL